MFAGLRNPSPATREHVRNEITAQRNALQQRLSALQRRMDQAYQDKLEGKIPADFWERKMLEWSDDERRIQGALARLAEPTPHGLLTAQRTLELAHNIRQLRYWTWRPFLRQGFEPPQDLPRALSLEPVPQDGEARERLLQSSLY